MVVEPVRCKRTVLLPLWGLAGMLLLFVAAPHATAVPSPSLNGWIGTAEHLATLTNSADDGSVFVSSLQQAHYETGQPATVSGSFSQHQTASCGIFAGPSVTDLNMPSNTGPSTFDVFVDLSSVVFTTTGADFPGTQTGTDCFGMTSSSALLLPLVPVGATCTSLIHEVLAPPTVQAIASTMICDEAPRNPGFTNIANKRHETLSVRVRRVDCDRSVDSDGGGIGDCQEYEQGSDPLVRDGVEVQLVPLTATVGVVGGGRGRISGSIDCGIGLPTACTRQFVLGSPAKLAALPSETSKFLFWEGCDSAVNQQCTLTMTGPRSVRASFAYDFVGQAEPPPDGLFDLDRKIEIASNGAENAQNGAIGCAATAAVIGTAGLGGEVLGVGVAGSGAALSELGAKLAEETIGNCVQGVLGTIGNGVLLTIDPPDPNWRKAAFAEFLPRAKVSGCKLRRACTRILAARRRLVDASTRVAELQEVLAVAANRYGNALGHADKPGLLVHRATMRATSGMLAAAIAVRDRRRAELAKHLRAAGVRSLVIPKRAARAALRQHAKGRGIPKAAIDRLLRKHLVTSAVEVRAAIRAGAGKTKATRLDILALLRRKTPTTAMRSAAAALTVADLAILLDAFHADRSTPAAVRVRHEELMGAILRCDAVSAANLKLLAKDVEAKTGLGGEPGRQVAFVARRLAAKGRPASPACG